MDRQNVLMTSLADKEYRHEYVEAQVAQGLAFQIRALRDRRGWPQEQLAQETGKKQETISQLENPDYGKYSLSTLKKLACAFDVALIVRFAPFSELVRWTVGLTPERLAPPNYDEERQLTFADIGVRPKGGNATTSDAQITVAATYNNTAAEEEFVPPGHGMSYEEEALRRLSAVHS